MLSCEKNLFLFFSPTAVFFTSTSPFKGDHNARSYVSYPFFLSHLNVPHSAIVRHSAPLLSTVFQN